MKYIKGLDTLRAFAVFFVMIQHKGVWFDSKAPNGRFIKQVLIPDGGFGVVLFFVLSGFLITTILLDQRSNVNNEKPTIVRNFFVRRALRIFPIYYLLLMFLYAINYQELAGNMVYHLTYTTNILCFYTNRWNTFSHAWTLGVEEQFYLLWPWVIIFVLEKYLRHVFWLSILIGITSTWYCMQLKGHMAPLLVFNCFDAFGIGGLFAYTMKDERSCKIFQFRLQWFALAALCIYVYWKVSAFFFITTYEAVFSKTVYAILSLWLINAVINAKPSAFRRYFLENSFLTFIGKISYGIYLYHYVYNVLVYNQLNNYLYRITRGHAALNSLVRDLHFFYWLHVALIIAISACSYYAIERPFLKLKKYFSNSEERRADLAQAG
jgi:peptidoglycan/LPS O-acetylase OafA/YrhL